MGSHDRENVQRVILRSAPESDEAQRAVIQAMVAKGWMELPAPPGSTRETGFIIPDNGIPRPVTLCHDDLGRLEVRGYTGVENRIYLQRFDYGASPHRTSCEEQRRNLLAPRSPERPAFNPAIAFIPALTAPGSSTPFAEGAVLGFVSSGGNRHETGGMVFGGGLSPGELLAHYAGQMREQDWEADAEWTGEMTAGGNWTRSVENGDRLMTTLLITRGNLNDVIGLRGRTGEEQDILSVKLIVQALE
ncbi:MAG: hypothetical protein RQ899_00690 [Pseudomonadales bacterium]|nr:hypothetical protein [Pseudomonadales bacterium]